MKSLKTVNIRSHPLFVALAILAGINHASAQNTLFSYQGSIAANGTNFSGAGQFKFALVTSTNANSQATATATLTGNFVTSIAVVSGGSGYTAPPAVTIAGGGGSGATATAAVSGGSVSSVTVNAAGSGYTRPPAVTIAPPSANVSYTTYWSNDGTSTDGSEPTASIAVPVVNGLFNVVLGDTTVANMAAIPASIFSSQPGLQLLIWFSDDPSGFVALSPAQNITPAPYATFATSASNLVGALPLDSIPAAVLTNNEAGVTLGDTTIDGNITMPVPAVLYGRQSAGFGILSYHYPMFISDALLNFYAGADAGNLTTTTNGNTGIGYDALSQDSSGANNTALGYSSLSVNTTGANNAAVGYEALQNNAGEANTAVGAQSLQSNVQGGANTAVGFQSLRANIATGNTACGSTALFYNTNGYYNTATGVEALYGNLSGNNNTANGAFALEVNNGDNNTADGAFALSGDAETGLTGVGNTAVGANALQSDSTGYNNTACGYLALGGNQTGVDNVAFGVDSFEAITTGSENTAVGTYTFQHLSSGAGNIGLGYYAGNSLTAGTNNIYIGNSGENAETGIIRIGTEGQQTATYLTGTVYANGVALTGNSNAKENFAPINPLDVLAKVAALPVTKWNYKRDAQATRHIGPMAQDFQAAFGLDGADDKHISVVDEGGVALAAIQGLNEKLKEKDAQIEELKQSIAQLKEAVSHLTQNHRSPSEPQAASDK